MAIVDRCLLQRGLNKSQCMDYPPKKIGHCGGVAIVERCLLVKVGLYNKIMYLVLPMRCSFILSKTGVMSSRVRVFCPANPLKNENSPPPRPEDLVLKNEK